MNSLLYLVLLACLALEHCATASRWDPPGLRPGWDVPPKRFQSLSRIRPKRPPPPFDLSRPYPARFPFPVPPVDVDALVENKEATTPPSSEEANKVLYKLDCDPCIPGWGLQSMCNETSSTVCKQCPLGTWSPRKRHFQRCSPCSKCGPGLFEESTCVTTRDTVCDSCFNDKAKVNEDFVRKCFPKDWKSADGSLDGELVFDVESKELSGELDKSDESDEYASNEEYSDPLKPSPQAESMSEKDITVDDPEIDSDLLTQDEKKEAEDTDEDALLEDVSKEEEEEWTRVMAMRQEANDEIEEISRRLTMEQSAGQQNKEEELVVDEDDDDDDDDDNEDDEEMVQEEPRRLLLHPIRPLPQMLPPPERTIEVETEDDIVEAAEDTPVENNFPPSYHGYPIDSLLHAGQGQRRKAIVLLVLTCLIVLTTMIFVVCYAREYCRRRGSMYNRVLVVNLTPEEREIVRQSAHVLESMERPSKKAYGNGYSPITNANSEVSICVTENPLESYLNAADERHVESEALIENEVFDNGNMHRENVRIA